jgi:hypothetical protein
MSFVKRAVTVTFQLLNGSFKGTDSNTATLSGLRVSARIEKNGGAGMFNAQVRIYGMSASLMNQLSTLGKYPLQERGNYITISAGDAESGMAVVFVGAISQAWIDFSNMPDVCLDVRAFTGMIDAMRPVPPTSYRGSVDVATILSGLAAQMGEGGLVFENSGVSVMLSNPYYPGTARQQAMAAAEAANINIAIDDGVLAIWPKGGARNGAIPMVSPDTGLVGYPSYTEQGIDLVTLYNPAIRFGGKVQVKSSIPQACGTWPVFALTHALDSETPNGEWFTHLSCMNFDHTTG